MPKEEVISVRTDIVSEEEMDEAEKLIESRYGTREWNETIP